MIALVLAGTVLPTTLFAAAQARVPADVAGAFVNLEPLVGAAAGTMLFGDPLGQVQLVGGAAIVAGIMLSSVQAIRSGHQPRAAAASATAAVAAITALPPAPAMSGRAESPASMPAQAESWSLHDRAGLARRNRLPHVTAPDAARRRFDRHGPASRPGRTSRRARGSRARDTRP